MRDDTSSDSPSIPAFEFELPWAVVLNGVQVPAGQCEVTWTEASGSSVQLTIKTADKKTVTLRATEVEGQGQYTAPVTSVVDGVRILKGFRTKNSTFTIDADQVGTK